MRVAHGADSTLWGLLQASCAWARRVGSAIQEGSSDGIRACNMETQNQPSNGNSSHLP